MTGQDHDGAGRLTGLSGAVRFGQLVQPKSRTYCGADRAAGHGGKHVGSVGAIGGRVGVVR